MLFLPPPASPADSGGGSLPPCPPASRRRRLPQVRPGAAGQRPGPRCRSRLHLPRRRGRRGPGAPPGGCVCVCVNTDARRFLPGGKRPGRLRVASAGCHWCARALEGRLLSAANRRPLLGGWPGAVLGARCWGAGCVCAEELLSAVLFLSRQERVRQVCTEMQSLQGVGKVTQEFPARSHLPSS